MRVCRLKGLGLAAVVAGTGIAVHAADYTWLNTLPNWGDAAAWNAGSGPCAWAAGNNAKFTTDGSAVTVAGPVSAARITAEANTTIRTNGVDEAGVTITASYVKVSSGKTLTMEAPLNQTDSNGANRLIREDGGTLDLQGGGSMYRMQQNNGTTKVSNGSTLTITGTSTSAGASGAVLGCTGGRLVVEGEGSKIVVAQETSYLPNSGSQIVVQNGGTIDASNVKEVLNGFYDNNRDTKSPYGSITVGDGGTFIAKNIRVGKPDKAFFDANSDYARINLLTNGVLKLIGFRMDDSTTYYGEVNFNGGVLHLTCADANVPFNNSNFTTYPWAGLHYYIREGGLRLNNAVGKNRTFNKPLESGAETDGGLTVEGTGGVLYMNAVNTFNGPTRLTGSGGVIYVPLTDAAFGAAPAEPTDNIVFESSGPTLHSDQSFVVHPNRTMRIKKNVTARIGNGGHLAFRGAVLGEAGQETTTAIRVVNNWGGSLTLVPDAGKVNRFGRLATFGHTVVGAGTTELVDPARGAVGNSTAVLYVGGESDKTQTAFDTWKGVLDITNGTLRVTDTAHGAYLVVANYGQLRVSGGTLDCAESHEILNAYGNAGRIEISGTDENPGLLKAYIVRVSQTPKMEGDLPAASITLRKGGTLQFHHFNIDVNNKPKGRVDFDGGILKVRSPRDNVLGSGTGAWTEILFRVCKGGLVIDTNNQKTGILAQLLTGVTEGTDGGLTKKGSNMLFIKNGSFTYTGPTRTDMGQFIFSDKEDGTGTFFALPGDVEVSVKELSKLSDSQRLGTYIEAKSISANAKLRVADVPVLADGTDPRTTFGKKIAILKTKEPMTKVPEIVLVDKDGNEKPSDGRWSASLSADRKTLTFGPNWITMIIVR